MCSNFLSSVINPAILLIRVWTLHSCFSDNPFNNVLQYSILLKIKATSRISNSVSVCVLVRWVFCVSFSCWVFLVFFAIQLFIWKFFSPKNVYDLSKKTSVESVLLLFACYRQWSRAAVEKHYRKNICVEPSQFLVLTNFIFVPKYPQFVHGN